MPPSLLALASASSSLPQDHEVHFFLEVFPVPTIIDVKMVFHFPPFSTLRPIDIGSMYISVFPLPISDQIFSPFSGILHL